MVGQTLSIISPVPPHVPLYTPGTSEVVGMSNEFKIVEARVDKNRAPRERRTGTLYNIGGTLEKMVLVVNSQPVILQGPNRRQTSQKRELDVTVTPHFVSFSFISGIFQVIQVKHQVLFMEDNAQRNNKFVAKDQERNGQITRSELG